MFQQASILVVDDNPVSSETLTRSLVTEGCEITHASCTSDALMRVDERPDLVFASLRVRSDGGLSLLERWKTRRAETPFVIITEDGDVHSAVAAMKLGAEDFVTRSQDPKQLRRLVERSVEKHRRAVMRGEMETSIERQAGFESMIGRSQCMRETTRQARRAAVTDSTVLIQGESGTGKELLAEAIHQNSPRSQGPFVPVNMAAVPENLIESELFGHVKGAFTGALESRDGRFQAADGGTLFIDEIGDFAPASQAKLLRVLETSFVTKVGSNKGHEVDVRVVAATSRNLAELVERGKFRGDLFYRLNVIQLRLPALRARRDDIPMLVKHFLREKSVLVGREVPSVSDELMEFLCRYAWPGNIRQLANCLESMVVLAEDEMLRVAHLPPDIREGQGGSQGRVMIPPGTTLEQLEQVAIRETLKEYQGNRTQTARALGISVRTLQRKLNG